MSRAFDHREDGTAESVWREAEPWASAPAVDLDIDLLVVLAAHPDDESLGAGGLIATAAERGIPIAVVIATDGDGSHPDSPTWTPRLLARERRVELSRALDELAPGSALSFLGLADGGLREQRRSLELFVSAIVTAAVRANSDLDDPHALDRSERPRDPKRTLLVAPWRGDGHRDHRVLGEVAEQIAREAGHASLAYPIWMWHWGHPQDIETDLWRVLPLASGPRGAKSRALDLHATQMLPLSPAPGDEALIHDGMRAHFERDVEVFVLPAPAPESAPDAAPASGPHDASPASLAPSFFDDFYARHDDPWGFDTRWYEERKRALVLATLPRQHFRDVLELGCATGALTVALRGRADRVLGVDASETALERARRRIAGLDSGGPPHPGAIELRRATLPGEWPEGEFDLVVMSEIGYYWSPSDLRDAARKSLAALSADGVLVACHWRHPVEEYPGTADEVHAVLRALPGLRLLARHEEEDFLLDVLVRENEPSVARAAGITP